MMGLIKIKINILNYLFEIASQVGPKKVAKAIQILLYIFFEILRAEFQIISKRERYGKKTFSVYFVNFRKSRYENIISSQG